MKILFICGSLEPGKNGVGDYTRLLAAELISQGHIAAIVSIYDSHVSEILHGSQAAMNQSISTLRLPVSLTTEKKQEMVETFIAYLNPDWISLQFVPFAFHPKGLPIQLHRFIRRLKFKGSWHIMCHELWIGKNEHTPLSKKVYRNLQRRIVLHLIKKIKFNVVNTHLPFYKTCLLRAGIKVRPLPLFANLVARSKNADASIKPNEVNEQEFVMIFFSQVSCAPSIKIQIEKVCCEKANAGYTTRLVFIGKPPANCKEVLAFYESIKGLDQINFLGFQPEDEIAETLRTADLGITPVPIHALGKSGSVAAFMDAGLPVLAPVYLHDQYKTFNGFFNEDLNQLILPEWNKDAYEIAKQKGAIAKSYLSKATIGKQFVDQLADQNIHS